MLLEDRSSRQGFSPNQRRRTERTEALETRAPNPTLASGVNPLGGPEGAETWEQRPEEDPWQQPLERRGPPGGSRGRREGPRRAWHPGRGNFSEPS